MRRQQPFVSLQSSHPSLAPLARLGFSERRLRFPIARLGPVVGGSPGQPPAAGMRALSCLDLEIAVVGAGNEPMIDQLVEGGLDRCGINHPNAISRIPHEEIKRAIVTPVF